jgi:GT2 family glycosyltransferase
VPVFNRIDLTVRFLESFRQIDYPNARTIIVDDGSTDGTARILAERFPEVVVLEGDGNLWWAGATNVGVQHALTLQAQYVLTINNDVQVRPDFLSRLVESAEENPRTVVGSRINFMDQPTRVWANGGYMDWESGRIFQLHDHGVDEADCTGMERLKPVEMLTGCGTLVPSQAYRDSSLYSARMFPQYHADSEFVLRARRRGYSAVVDLSAVIFNDAAKTRLVTKQYDIFFSRRSSFYWRPMLAIHLKYCPLRYLRNSWRKQYESDFPDGVSSWLMRHWLKLGEVDPTSGPLG